MTTTKITVFLFAILAPSAIILAQESSDPPSRGPGDEPTTQTAASSTSGIFDNFPFKPPPDHDLNALWNHFAAAGFGSRTKRSPEDQSEIEEHLRAKRSVVTCNFSTQGGFRCTGCKTVRRCYSFNYGTVTTCGGLFPYCNKGVCSRVKGSLCSSTTSTSTSSTSSTSTTTTTTTARTNSTG